MKERERAARWMGRSTLNAALYPEGARNPVPDIVTTCDGVGAKTFIIDHPYPVIVTDHVLRLITTSVPHHNLCVYPGSLRLTTCDGAGAGAQWHKESSPGYRHDTW